MATASRELPFFVLIETAKGKKFYSSYATQGEADTDAARLAAKKLAATVVAKSDGDALVPDKSAQEQAPQPEERQALDVVADKTGAILIKVDKASLTRFLSVDDAEKVLALKAGETVQVETDLASVGEITKGTK